MKIIFTLMICSFALQMAIAQEVITPPVEAPSAIVEEKASDDERYNREVQPEFPGGIKALFEFMDSTIQYPLDLQACMEGKVIVQFVVKEDGTIDMNKIKIARGIHPLLDAEAIRVIKLMPKWIPGRQRGKPVPVWFTLPVNFSLQ